MTRQAWPPHGWREHKLEARAPERRSHRYYEIDRRADAPSVMLLHEWPGISASLVGFAERLAEDFRIVVPSVLGRDGHPTPLHSLTQLCVRREVELLRTGKESRAIPWLRRLLDEHVARGGPCGVVGMCMTGGFALALAVHPRVRAGVVAQPALPASSVGRFPLPGRSRRSGDLGLDSSTRQELRSRLTDDPGCLRANGYRFDGDRLSPSAKLASAADLLGGAFTLRTLTPDRAGSTPR